MTAPDAEPDAIRVRNDPNLVYQESLSPAEFTAYQVALYGDANGPGGGSASSCSGRAAAQFPEPALSDDRVQTFDAEFSDLIRSAWASVVADDSSAGLDDDPRTIQLDEEWGSCMAKKGSAVAGREIDHGPKLAPALALRTRPDGTVGPLHLDPVPVTDIPVEETSLLGTEPERKVALADFDCRAETDYLARLTAIRVSRDEDFIAAHQAELDRLTAAAETW